MKLATLQDLFIHLLQDAHSAEKQLTEALPKMAKGATNPELRKAFEDHLAETTGHLNVIADLLESFDTKSDDTKCAAMAGIVREGSEFLDSDIHPAVRDAALIAAAQRAEHYEIAAYGTLIAYAELMRHTEAQEALEEILDQETTADENLSALSDGINPLAAKQESVTKAASKK